MVRQLLVPIRDTVCRMWWSLAAGRRQQGAPYRLTALRSPTRVAVPFAPIPVPENTAYAMCKAEGYTSGIKFPLNPLVYHGAELILR